jgi:hypothetical protein
MLADAETASFLSVSIDSGAVSEGERRLRSQYGFPGQDPGRYSATVRWLDYVKRLASMAANKRVWPIRHGKQSGYLRGCRCVKCRAANAHTIAISRAVRRITTKFEDIPHGTLGGYNNYYCRCDLCRAANSAHWAKYKRERGL